MMRVVVKNTFVDIQIAGDEDAVGRRSRRCRSLPHAGSSGGWLDDAAVREQIERLGAALCVGGSVEPSTLQDAAAPEATLLCLKGSGPSSRSTGDENVSGDSSPHSTDDASVAAVLPTEDPPTARSGVDADLARVSSVLQAVPLDDSGRITSIGSVVHAQGICRPCVYARSARGCKFGIACEFCHFVSEHYLVPRARPCKQKRDRIKKA